MSVGGRHDRLRRDRQGLTHISSLAFCKAEVQRGEGLIWTAWQQCLELSPAFGRFLQTIGPVGPLPGDRDPLCSPLRQPIIKPLSDSGFQRLSFRTTLGPLSAFIAWRERENADSFVIEQPCSCQHSLFSNWLLQGPVAEYGTSKPCWPPAPCCLASSLTSFPCGP